MIDSFLPFLLCVICNKKVLLYIIARKYEKSKLDSMNFCRFIMKNSDINALRESFRFRIVGCGQVRLGSFWDKLHLSSHFWRLYCHDAPGAGVITGGKKIELLPGYIYLLPPNNDLVSWCTENPKQLYFHFETSLYSGSSSHLCNSVKITPELFALLDELRSLVPATESKSSNRQILLATALASLALSKLPEEALTRMLPDMRTAKICDLLRSHMAEELSLDFLAAKANMTKRSFLRRFTAFTGSTPHQYLMNMRYMQAAQFLEEGEKNIDEICELIGVHDRFHFSRMFRKMFGVPPGRYRNLHQGKDK